MIARTLYRFSNFAQQYKQILPVHIINILKQDQQSNAFKYKNCRTYLDRIIQNYSIEQAKIKANMLFNTDCLNQALQNIKPSLCQLIMQGTIQNQYQLDQVIKWVSREIKFNKNIDKKAIIHKLSRRQEEQVQFKRELQVIKQRGDKDLNQICKQMRDKYITIDSQIIYQQLKPILQQSSTQPSIKKENKLWDKLLQIKPRRIKQECNSKQIYEQHLKITQGRPRFRFPPQPNGYLHIGHVKSIRVNFESAKRNNGVCFLRYDDTNPDKQTHEFIAEIENNVKWLGYTPDKITFASDYFEQLLYYAHQLIKQGHAYVCDSSKEEIQAQRKNRRSNPYRQRTIEESLKIFPHLQPNQTLRLKWIPESPNPTLRDPIMYRLKSKPHPRTGDKYKIYPMYDFTHCISDSIQHIDYSLCSLQFQIRRQLYYIFLDLLGLYKPTVWQYSRLNIEGNVLSKRKIKSLIEEGKVQGWDDPRLLTIRGLQNRGYTPQMLKSFIDKVNCSRTGNQNIIQFNLLEKQMKKVLLKQAYKTMAVLQPFPAQIINQNSINNEKIFLQRDDVDKIVSDQFIILKSLGVFRVKDKNASLMLLEKMEIEDVPAFRKQNPKTKIIHWISNNQTKTFTVVMYDRLLIDNDQPNPNSKVVYKEAQIPSTLSQQGREYIQFERIGFFKFSPKRDELWLCTHL